MRLTDGTQAYLNITSATILDVDPSIPDADWLRRWSIRQRSREAVNPDFPGGVFNLDMIKTGPLRCLYTIGTLDEFARAAPSEIFQGYLSVLITEVRLRESRKRRMLFASECCSMPLYANDLVAACKGCDKNVPLRLNPKIVAQVMDETGVVGSGKLLFSDQAWRSLLGRAPADVLKLNDEGIGYLSDRLLFCRLTLLFGWTGDESKAGGRICVLDVSA